MKIYKSTPNEYVLAPMSLKSLKESAKKIKNADIIVSVRRAINPNSIICLNNNI